jgi:hypothetical protein
LAKQTVKQTSQNLRAWHVETCIRRIIHDTHCLLSCRPHDYEASEMKEITRAAFPKDRHGRPRAAISEMAKGEEESENNGSRAPCVLVRHLGKANNRIGT